MTLQDWLNSSWIKPHATNKSEIQNLLETINRDITESEKEGISPDWRLAIAYNACLGCATAALYIIGYRIPPGSGKHYRSIQSLRYTLNPAPELLLSLEAISKKRSIASYDMVGTVSDVEVAEAIRLAVELRQLLMYWIQKEHGQYLP